MVLHLQPVRNSLLEQHYGGGGARCIQANQTNQLSAQQGKLNLWKVLLPLVAVKVDELKLKTIFEFEEEYESIRHLMSPKASSQVEDQLNNLQHLKRTLTQRRDCLIDQQQDSIISEGDLLKK